MNHNPLVSIIIPVFNGENYLAIALESALKQSYSNIEIIVVDDGSRDPVEVDIICRNLSADILVFHKENGGVSSALNYGLKVMSGEWFIWLSHDDVLEENFVSTAISVCGEYDVVSQNTLHIDEIGNHLKFQSIVTSLKYKNAIKNFSNLYMLTLSGEFSFNGCALMIRKEVLQEHQGFQIAFKYIQDYILWIEMILNERRFYFLDRIGVYNRIHKRQQSHNKELLETESTLFFLNSEEILLNNKRFNKVKLYSSLAIYSNRINNVFLRKYFLTKLFRINRIMAIITALRMYIYRVMLMAYKTIKV